VWRCCSPRPSALPKPHSGGEQASPGDPARDDPDPWRSDGSFSARVTARWLVPIELTVAGHISGGTASGSATFTASHGQAVANATGFVRGDGPVAFDGSPAAQHVGRTVHINVTVATAVPDDIVQSGAVTYRAWWVRLVLPEALIGNFGENNCSHDTVRHQVVTHPVPPDGRIQFTDSWVARGAVPRLPGRLAHDMGCSRHWLLEAEVNGRIQSGVCLVPSGPGGVDVDVGGVGELDFVASVGADHVEVGVLVGAAVVDDRASIW
jgi:hypothetical protein